MTARPGGDPVRGGDSGSVAGMSTRGDDGGGSRAEGRGSAGSGAVPTWLAIVSAVVLVVGLAALVVAVVFFGQGRSDRQIASEREAVADVAAQVIINAFSFDHRNVDDSLRQLAEASTGDFLVEQEQWADDVRTRVVEQKAVTTATVSHTAVETLDLDAGDAAVLVVFTAHSEREGQDDITGRQAMRVDLTRVDGQWKADAVNQVGVTVPVGTSSRSVQDLQMPEAEEPDAGESTDAPAPSTTAGR